MGRSGCARSRCCARTATARRAPRRSRPAGSSRGGAAHVVLAAALQATGDEAGAVRAARARHRARSGGSPRPATSSARAARAGPRAEAVPVLEGAVAVDPEHAGALNNLAVARLRARRALDPAPQFEAAARLDPRSDVARHNILAVGPAGRSRALPALERRDGAVADLAGGGRPAGPGRAGLRRRGRVRAAPLRSTCAGSARRPVSCSADDSQARRWRPHRWNWGWSPGCGRGGGCCSSGCRRRCCSPPTWRLLVAAIATPVVFWIVALRPRAAVQRPPHVQAWCRRRHPAPAPGARPRRHLRARPVDSPRTGWVSCAGSLRREGAVKREVCACACAGVLLGGWGAGGAGRPPRWTSSR